MKSLPLKTIAYRYIEQGFSEWLDTLGYAPATVYEMPNKIREYLHYMEQQGNTTIQQINRDNMQNYYQNHLKNRKNDRRAGGLDNATLNKHLQAITKFSQYLRQSGRHQISTLQIKWETRNQTEIDVLTEQEIQQLYAACDQYSQGVNNRKPEWFYPAIALRDKAMLTVYYGCGLRRNEGQHMEISDINWDKQLLYVRKGKNNTERYVPINRASQKHLENYLYEARPKLLKYNKEERYFISERGRPITGQSMLLRLNQLISRTDNPALQQKEIGLHTLRHSIATHLLTNGMKIEKIKEFLGHSSLESTQLYTHLIEKEAELGGKNTL